MHPKTSFDVHFRVLAPSKNVGLIVGNVAEPNTDPTMALTDTALCKYVQVSQAAEILNRIGTEIEAILRDSGAAIANV